MLVCVLDHVYDGRHGTFVVDSRKETIEHGFLFKSSCVWAEVMADHGSFLNKAFDSDAARVLLPAFSTKTLQFWQGYYLRFDDSCVDPGVEEVRPVESYSSSKPSNLSNDRVLRRCASSQLAPAQVAAAAEAESAIRYMCRGLVLELVGDAIILSLEARVAALESKASP